MKKIRITKEGRAKIEEIILQNMFTYKEVSHLISLALMQNMIVNMLESKRKQGEEFIEIL